MKTEQIGQWEEMSAEILSGMREWRVVHKRATLAEIERYEEALPIGTPARLALALGNCCTSTS